MRYWSLRRNEPWRQNGSGRAVKVDVAVVAKDYLASELIGSSFFNDKDEEIGSLGDIGSRGDIVIDQKKAFRNTSERRISRLGWVSRRSSLR
jgi:hypothetical protein